MHPLSLEATLFKGSSCFAETVRYLKNILLVHKPEPTVCGLQIVKSLPHVTISCENDSFKTFRDIGYLQSLQVDINHKMNSPLLYWNSSLKDYSPAVL